MASVRVIAGVSFDGLATAETPFADKLLKMFFASLGLLWLFCLQAKGRRGTCPLVHIAGTFILPGLQGTGFWAV